MLTLLLAGYTLTKRKSNVSLITTIWKITCALFKQVCPIVNGDWVVLINDQIDFNHV